MCDLHYRANLVILALHKNKIDTTTLLTIGLQDREDKLNELATQTGKTVEALLDEALQYEQSFKSLG